MGRTFTEAPCTPCRKNGPPSLRAYCTHRTFEVLDFNTDAERLRCLECGNEREPLTFACICERI